MKSTGNQSSGYLVMSVHRWFSPYAAHNALHSVSPSVAREHVDARRWRRVTFCSHICRRKLTSFPVGRLKASVYHRTRG